MIAVGIKVRRPRRRRALRVWGRQDTEAVLDEMAAAQRAQIEQGERPDGTSIGVYKSGRRAGQVITLRRTGRTLASMRPRSKKYEGTTGPTTAAAVWLQRKYRVFGLSAKSLEAAEKAARERFAENTKEL